MTQRTRYFLVGSALVVVVGLGTGLVAYYNGSLPFGVGRRQDAELAYCRPTSTALAYADVRRIMSSEFRQKLRAGAADRRGEGRASARDSASTSSATSTSWSPASPATTRRKGGALVLVRGRFNDGQIETHGGAARRAGRGLPRQADAADAPQATHARRRGPADARRRPAARRWRFLEPGLLALGDAAQLRQAIDRPGTKTDVTDERRADEARQRRARRRQRLGRRPFRRVLEACEPARADQVAAAGGAAVAVSAHVNGGVNGTLRAETRDEQAAQDLQGRLSGALAAGRLMAGQDQRANAVLNSLQVGGTDKTVTLAFAVSPEVLDMLSGFAGHARRRGRSGQRSECRDGAPSARPVSRTIGQVNCEGCVPRRPRSSFVGAARTPIGRYGGTLRSTHPAELGARAARAALERAGVAPADVDEVLIGHARQAGSGPESRRGRSAAAPACPTTFPRRPSTRRAPRACRPSRSARRPS